MPTPEEIAVAEAAIAASQQTPEQIAATEEAARVAAAEAVAEKVIYTSDELAKITPTDIDLDRVDPAYRPIVENTIRDYKELQKDHTRKSQASKDAEREAKYWRDLALKKEKEEPPVIEPVSVLARPKLDQFETVEQYEDSLLAWHEKKRTIETQTETVRKRTEEATRTFQEKAATLRAEHDDFDETIEAPVFTPAMKVALLNAENGPTVAYYLGKAENRQVAQKIASLPVEMQLYELGKLETQLVTAQKTKKVPGAPPPLKTVGIGGGGTTEVDTSKMSDGDWFKYDQQQRLLRTKKKTGG